MSRLWGGTVADLMTYAPIQWAFGTILIVAKIVTTNDAAWQSFIEAEPTGVTPVRYALGRSSAGNLYLSNDVTSDQAVSATDADGWALFSVTKATGSAAPQFRKNIIGGAPTGGTGGVALGNSPANTVRIYLGGNDDPANIKVAAAAIFNGTVLTTGQLDGIASAATTQSIADLSPTWLIDDSDAFATNLVNPGTGDRTAIAGTADDADDPAGWVYGIAAPVIPITVVGAGAVAFGAAAGTTVAPTIPTHAAGDLLVAVRAMKHSTTETLTAEAGWTRGVAEQAGGTGSFAADTGPTKIAIDYLQATGSGTTVTFDNTAVANTVAWAQVIVLRKGIPGAYWSVNGVSGTDNSAGAAYSVAFASNPGLELGDYAVVGVSTPTDITASHWSAPTLTATGLTATATEQGDAVSGNGFDIGAGSWTVQVTAGPATAAATFAATAGGTTTNMAGPCALLRVRADATPTLAMSPPRR